MKIVWPGVTVCRAFVTSVPSVAVLLILICVAVAQAVVLMPMYFVAGAPTLVVQLQCCDSKPPPLEPPVSRYGGGVGSSLYQKKSQLSPFSSSTPTTALSPAWGMRVPPCPETIGSKLSGP